MLTRVIGKTRERQTFNNYYRASGTKPATGSKRGVDAIKDGYKESGGEFISFPHDTRGEDESRTPQTESGGAGSGAAPRLPLQPTERQPGEVVAGKYTVLSTLGEGSTSVTYEACAEDGLRVAVKELSLGRLKSWKQFDLFEREAAMLRSLNHPSIPKYIEYMEVDGSFVLVQELADGATLQRIVQGGQHERFDEEEVQRIARSLLDTLGYLSSRRRVGCPR